MAWVTEEEYQAAKQVRAYEYLQTYQPGRLKKTRTRNEWQLQDHDSFKINEITSKWHWKSRGIGGMSALRFLMQVDGMGYTEGILSRRFCISGNKAPNRSSGSDNR